MGSFLIIRVKNKTMKKLFVFSGFVWLCLVDVNAHSSVQTNPSKRSRECFDENWMFHKGDIAIKHAIGAGKYGGLTDRNVKVVTNADTDIVSFLFSQTNRQAKYN